MEFQNNEIEWNLMFSPSQWWLTPTMVKENLPTLALTLGSVAFSILFFLFSKSRGDKSEFFLKLKTAKTLKIPDNLVILIWNILYLPLALGAWLVYYYGDKKWSRALTVYSLHMVVNLLFPVSFWWIKDLSLALLNLITLIGVAMFATSQFSNTLYFAGQIQTPYLLFLLMYTIQFCYVWYLNEGKELMDLTKQLGGKSGAAASGAGKKLLKGPPKSIKDKLRAKVAQQVKDMEEESKQKKSDSEEEESDEDKKE